MSKGSALEFYSSSAWKSCRETYKKKMRYICEECGEVATEVHHIKHITAEHVTDPEVTLNFDNLMCLCHRCHMKAHSSSQHHRRYIIDEEGHVIIAGE